MFKRIMLAIAVSLASFSGAWGADSGPYAGVFWGMHHWNEGGSKYGVFGGYQFTRSVGAEAGLVETGIAEGVEATGVFSQPVTKAFDVYMKAGAFANVHAPVHVNPVFGIGVSYKATPRWSFRGQVQRYFNVSGVNVDAATLGVVVDFR